MPQQNIAGPGLYLPPPQQLYPASLYQIPYSAGTNQVNLGPGQVMIVPPGDWIAMGDKYSTLQWRDPVRQEWSPFLLTNYTATAYAWAQHIRSDGVNFRIANTTDAWYTGIVSVAGTGYVQASTTVTAGTGNSTWVALVGGALGTFTMVTQGSGYTVVPTVFIPSPPPPGIAATAVATLSAGAITGITIEVAGAGYLTAPPVVIIPSPMEPSTSNIVTAKATVALTGSGTLTGVLLANMGTLLTTAPTLTVNGVGSSATATTSPATVLSVEQSLVTLQPV
jgi:hypothetical protein